MEKDSAGNRNLFDRILKTIRSGKQNYIKNIETKDQKIIAEGESIMNRWKEHFMEMLNPEIIIDELEGVFEEPQENFRLN